jgi:hypothetical protein
VSALDIRGLRALVATAKQQQDRFASPGEIHAIPRSDVHYEFCELAANQTNISKVSVPKTSDAANDTHLSDPIFQRGKPHLKFHGRFDLKIDAILCIPKYIVNCS